MRGHVQVENRRRTGNAMAARKRTHTDLQNPTQKKKRWSKTGDELKSLEVMTST